MKTYNSDIAVNCFLYLHVLVLIDEYGTSVDQYDDNFGDETDCFPTIFP